MPKRFMNHFIGRYEFQSQSSDPQQLKLQNKSSNRTAHRFNSRYFSSKRIPEVDHGQFGLGRVRRHRDVSHNDADSNTSLEKKSNLQFDRVKKDGSFNLVQVTKKKISGLQL